MFSPAIRSALLSLLALLPAGAGVIETDICVYGGAAGGVTAAVQAKRLGKSVSLLVFNNHLGGLSSGGLGETDIGHHGDTYIQGIAREFYTRVGAKYGSTGARFRFEPKVAEAVFNEMAQQAGVPVYLNQRLATTTVQGGRITEIAMENGNIFRAKVFLDASYEGDLLKQAGVSYTAGREANSQYGETINGIQTTTSGNQVRSGISAYVIPGNPASGVLPGVNPGPLAPNGSADSLIQAYCYRMCLTNVAANRIMIAQPEGYNEADYEILFRNIEAGQTDRFWKLSGMPNGKTDSNNDSGVSCDYITGTTGSWVEADYATRDAIARAHEKWQRGLVWTIQNHPRVPAAIRTTWSQWGLPKDEFTDNNNWSHQLYVREARRMISDYVMTEKNCMGTVVAADSIALGAYTMDSHNCQRYVSNGTVRNEGDIQRGVPGPYPIAYRSIVPKAGECTNLLVPWSLSATHISFGSVRMEPVFMNVGQAAATAAAFAIDDDIPVQQVSYPKLRIQLLADKQRLVVSEAASDPGITVDNSDATGVTLTGTWTESTTNAGYYGLNYIHEGNTAKGAASVRYTPVIPSTGSYNVHILYTSNGNRATNVPVDIAHAAGTTTAAPINQQTGGGEWKLLGTFNFNAGFSPSTGSVTVRNTGTDGYVIADAVRFVSTATPSLDPTVSIVAANALTSEPPSSQPSAAIVTVHRSGGTTASLVVNLAITGSATPGADYAALPASVTIPAGSAATSLSIAALADALVEGDETLTVTAGAGTGYTPGTLASATITLRDNPFDAWRKSVFTPAQLADPAISGERADPDHDGLHNLMEYYLGRLPGTPDPSTALASGTITLSGQSYLTLTYTRLKTAAVTGLPQFSTDLADWKNGPSFLEESIISDVGNTQTITARSVVPIGTLPKQFLRLKVTRP